MQHCTVGAAFPARPAITIAAPRASRCSYPLACRLLEGLQVYLPAGQFSTLLDRDALRVSFRGKESAKPPTFYQGSSGDDDDGSGDGNSSRADGRVAAKNALRVHHLSRAQALLTPNYAVLDTLVRPTIVLIP